MKQQPEIVEAIERVEKRQRHEAEERKRQEAECKREEQTRQSRFRSVLNRSSMKDKVHSAYSRKQSVLTSTKMKIKLFIMASWLPL